jgi:hypothetical protein
MQRVQRRFVELIGLNGKSVCAPIIVEFPDFSYTVSDSEFEHRAIKIAIADGLIAPGQVGEVQARVGG